MNGTSVELPSPAAIIPYIGLFTLVTLDPSATATNVMATPYLPSLSIILNDKFVMAPANTSATTENVARIYEPLGIDEDTPTNAAILPISHGAEAFEEKHFWRLPVPTAAIFAALMARLPNDLSGCEDITLAKTIVALLTLKRYSGSGSVGRGGGRGGGGGSSRGGRQSKRKNASSDSTSEKGKKKARNVADGDMAGECGECSDASHLGPSLNEFLPGVRSLYGQSNLREIASSTLGDDTPAKLIDADKDSENGRSEHS